ncbi:hypothetical protein BLNAU_22721 [Blattamonas nauphoetae]|uniref:Uncharacterized protein n=1 Tax=Blattamonas nauphoetae TaxID=2049346 RepID=A0ABQ9WSS4_9EUKA|nr:hypothetical protein BLNAU_22721 [Blattamonas nauphoetae]
MLVSTIALQIGREVEDGRGKGTRWRREEEKDKEEEGKDYWKSNSNHTQRKNAIAVGCLEKKPHNKHDDVQKGKQTQSTWRLASSSPLLPRIWSNTPMLTFNPLPLSLSTFRISLAQQQTLPKTIRKDRKMSSPNS